MNHKIEVAKIEVAIVEPIKPLAICLQSYLAGSHFDCRSYFDASAFLETLTSSTANICIISGRLIHHNNASILTSIKNQQPEMILIAITDSQANEERLNEERLNIVAAGLTNILEHPISKETLLSTLEKLTHHITPTLAADNALTDSSLLEVQRPSVKSVKTQYYGFIGQSERMQQVYNTINAAAESKATVFITGESGTGKEVCAAAIHERSKRRQNPFVPINCAAIPKDLMESEIFGHTKGAFTGAHARREGAASRADQGTLFLDEIGEMDLDLQSKLLRFIQTGTFQKVGSSTIESVDIRFICATNKDPLEQIKNGSFREDLYYRLHVIPIYLPPLRARGHDVLLIAQAFLDRYSNEEARDFTQFSPETKKTFLDYDWPGNIRQLQNVIRNVVVLNNGLAVNKEMLPPPLNQLSTSIATDMDKGPIDIHQGRHKNNPSSATENPHPTPQDRQPEPLNNHQADSHPPHKDEILSTANIKPLWQIEKAYIESAIHACDKNIPKAAKHLGVSPSTLYRKLHQWKDQSLASASTSTTNRT